MQQVFNSGDRGGNYVHINGSSLSGSGGLTVDTMGGTATSRFIVIGSTATPGRPWWRPTASCKPTTTTRSTTARPSAPAPTGLGSAVTVNIGGILTVFSNGASVTVALGSLSASGTVHGEGGGTHTLKIGGDGTDTLFSGVLEDGSRARWL